MAFTIAALSRRSDCSTETIGYSARIGLLPLPRRSAGGRRVYGAPDLKRLT
jgi:MerR family mercuric resistance operon transcriptional regulator